MKKEEFKNKNQILKKFNKKPSFREEANVLTYYCFRNSFLEDLHAGKHSKLLEDPQLSRITEQEMKKLMIETSAELAHFLEIKQKHPKKYRQIINLFSDGTLRDWEKKAEKYNIKKGD
ncbi:MAG: hypothetical protein Q7R52_04800 [archaeon]|nr:hypothetical protein [archaeon]